MVNTMNASLAESVDYDYETAKSFNSTETSDAASSDGGSNSIDAEIYLMALRMVVGIVGVLGNLTVCIVVMNMKSKEVKFLIVSQASIDFLTSFVLVTGTVTSRFLYTQLVSPKNQVLGYMYCMFWHWDGLLFYLFSISTYNLVAISIERYMAVLYAIWYRTGFTPKKAMMLGAALWVIAPAMQLIYCIKQTAYFDGTCHFVEFTKSNLAIAGSFLFLWDYFVPCVIMGFCFTRISMELREQDERAKSLREGGGSSKEISTVSGKVSWSAAEERKATSRSRNVTKTFLLVFLAFVLCWATNQFLFLQFNLGGYRYHGNPENHFANTMAILNSTINPFIFVFRFQQYREKLKQIFCCRG